MADFNEPLTSAQIEELLKATTVSEIRNQTAPLCENCKTPTKRVEFITEAPVRIRVIDSGDTVIWRGFVNEHELICLTCGKKTIWTKQLSKKGRNDIATVLQDQEAQKFLTAALNGAFG